MELMMILAAMIETNLCQEKSKTRSQQSFRALSVAADLLGPRVWLVE
jgi:hypothetical protein